MEYIIAEMFCSINGEGTRAGRLAYFVRFAGCNLNCSFCDTRWANLPDTPVTRMSAAQICEKVLQSQVSNVTITGGEPLIQPGIDALLIQLAETNKLQIEVETNGGVALKDHMHLPDAVSFTMDYKLPGSGEEAAMVTDNLNLLRSRDTVKFVVGDKEDLTRAYQMIRQYDLTSRCHVFFSPVFGRIELETIVYFMKSNYLNDVSLQLQLHKVIWDPQKRGV